MINVRKGDKRKQLMIAIDDLVPEDHLVRKIEKEKIHKRKFIYDLVKDKYSLKDQALIQWC
ncbi:hypothetical protein AS160_06440 [Marinitoga sp. 38H-ov]|nr:hypothetical protein AS160_06440 [Marinitoga sp. 38H-ov]